MQYFYVVNCQKKKEKVRIFKYFKIFKKPHFTKKASTLHKKPSFQTAAYLFIFYETAAYFKTLWQKLPPMAFTAGLFYWFQTL